MLIQKQGFDLPIENLDSYTGTHQFQRHGTVFGGNCKRGIIIGPSGSGKTNVLINLLKHPNGLRFENVYIFSKSLHQPKYDYLRELFKPMKEIGYNEYSSTDNIISTDEIKSNSIVIFDDIVTQNQTEPRNFFCFGRHKDVDCFYLSQTYSSIPKQLIRDNANLIVMFKQDSTNLRHVYDDHVCTDMKFDKFVEMCSTCWRDDKFNFIVIDKDCELNKGRYRKGFDSFIII